MHYDKIRKAILKKTENKKRKNPSKVVLERFPSNWEIQQLI